MQRRYSFWLVLGAFCSIRAGRGDDGFDHAPLLIRHLPLHAEATLHENGNPDASDAAERALASGAQEAGIDFGGAKGMLIFGGGREHDFLLTSVHYGWVFSELMGEDRWYQGNWELRAEIFGGKQIAPDNGYILGALPVLRYNFLPAGHWSPFVDLGSGLALTDIGAPDLSRSVQLNFQLGTGVQYFFSENAALSVQYRLAHVSNGRTQSPDPGLNTNMFMVGMNWFF